MSENAPSRNTPNPRWRARALLCGSDWADAAYGFGGPDVAEMTGTPEKIGTELARFLDSLELENVEAERTHTGHFAVQVEVEPLDLGPVMPAEPPPGDLPAETPVRLWEASASVGNADGVFDACYRFGTSKGDEGHLLGAAQELGAELTHVLKGLTRGDIEIMKFGTDRFFVRLLVELPQQK